MAERSARKSDTTASGSNQFQALGLFSLGRRDGGTPCQLQDERFSREQVTTQRAAGKPSLGLHGELLALWDEYDAAATPEAQAVKALDKLETMLQHNQGANPADFDYAFNLGYGRKHTGTTPLFSALRELVDADTRRRMAPLHGQQAGR